MTGVGTSVVLIVDTHEKIETRLGKREPLRAGGRGEIQWPRGLMVWHRTNAPMLEGGEPATNPTKHDSKTQRMVAMKRKFGKCVVNCFSPG